MKSNIKIYFKWLFRCKKSFVYGKPTYEGYRYACEKIEYDKKIEAERNHLNKNLYEICVELGITEEESFVIYFSGIIKTKYKDQFIAKLKDRKVYELFNDIYKCE